MTGHEGGDLSLPQEDRILAARLSRLPLDKLGQFGERWRGVDPAPFDPLKSGFFKDIPGKEEEASGDHREKHEPYGEDKATCATELHGSKTIAPAYISRPYKKIWLST
jgi:hypothetical protein